MSGLNSIVVVLVVMAVVIATAVADRHQQELKEHYEHLAYIAEFNCHRPQPRVIPMHELFPEEEIAHKAFFPDVTVLHRCDSSVGCCPSNHHCRPKHTHSLHLPFKVTYLEHIGKHKKGSWIIDYHTFENHTECECVDATVCVLPTEHEEHKPDHHESSHKPEHHGEPHHEPEHHESSHKPEHHGEPHHEPEHHEPSHKPEHHSESHHEPDHHESSHKTEHHTEVHHEEVHVEESHHEPDHHSESSHNTEHHEESHQEIDDRGTEKESQPSSGDNSVNSPSYKPEDSPAEAPTSPIDKEQETESSTLPLLVASYVYSSSSTTKKADETDISSFFD